MPRGGGGGGGRGGREGGGGGGGRGGREGRGGGGGGGAGGGGYHAVYVLVLKHCRGRSEFHVSVVHWLLPGSGNHQDSCQYTHSEPRFPAPSSVLEEGGRQP